MSEIIVNSFIVLSREDKHHEPLKKIFINAERGECFIFSDKADLGKFIDELRQTFEQVMPFGCEILISSSRVIRSLTTEVFRLSDLLAPPTQS